MVLKKMGTWYMILIGFSILGLWAMLLSTGQMPELTTQPAYAAFHLITEALTGILL